MTSFNPGRVVTGLSAAAIAAFVAVKATSNAQEYAIAGLGDKVAGVLLSAASAAGQELNVCKSGSAKIQLEDAVAKEDLVIVAASGKGKKAKKIVATSTASTDVFASVAHGLVAGDRVIVSGEGASTMPTAGLIEGRPYYVIASGLTADAFKLSPAAGGSTIDMTGDGVALIVKQDNGAGNVIGVAQQAGAAGDFIEVELMLDAANV